MKINSFFVIAFTLLMFRASAQTTIFNSPGSTITLSSQTFPGDVRILPHTTVVIPSGVLILMQNTKKIYLEGDGAKLLIDGGHISAAVSYFGSPSVPNSTVTDKWGGIEVWGNKNYNHIAISYILSGAYPQNYSQAQGVLIMKNNAKISFANRAVMLGKASNRNFGGGIVYAENSLFMHNDGDVIFDPYSKQNVSRFINVHFKHYQDPSWAPPQAYVGLIYGVRGILFDGCEFEGGISSAGFSVNDMPNGLLCSQTGITVKNSTFSFISRAIDIHNTSLFGSTVITGNSFLMAYKSVALTGVDNATVQGNAFTGIHGPSTIDVSYGIYLEGCSGYKIRDNNFARFTAENINRGIFVSNSGSLGNKINNNGFKDNTGGIQAQDNNMGLQIKCNGFVNNANGDNTGFRDAIVIAQNYVPASLRGIPNQGAIIPGDVLGVSLAGNSFSWRCGSDNLRTITTSDYTATSNVNKFEYRYHTETGIGQRVEPKCYSTSKIALKPSIIAPDENREPSCEQQIIDPPGGWANVDIKKNQVAYMKQQPPPIDQDGIVYLEKSIQADIYEIVNLYAEQENYEAIIADLQVEKDDFKRTILIPVLLFLGQHDDAAAELEAIVVAEDDIEMSDFVSYYTILINAMTNSIELSALTDTEIIQLEGISNGATPTAAKAKNLLEIFYEFQYPELIYELPEEEYGKTTTGLSYANGNKQMGSITVYPSPASTTLTIKAAEEILSVEIIDLTGKTVLTGGDLKSENTVVLSAIGIPSGIYTAKVLTKTGVALQKFTVIH